MMENDIEKLKRAQEAILVLYGHLGSGHLEALHALNTVSATSPSAAPVVEGCRVIHRARV